MDRLAQCGLEIKSDDLVDVENSFAQLLSGLETSLAEKRRVDLVERELFANLLDLGLELLRLFFRKSGDGDLGESVETVSDGVLQRSDHKKTRRYQSVFGNVDVVRFVYAKREKQKALLMPLDQRLGLPANDQSYVLEDWLQRFVVKETFHEAVTSLKTLLNVSSSVRSAERMTRDLARYCVGFRPDEAVLPGDDELLVATADGKGVPMRESLNQRKHEKYGTKLYEPQNTTGTVKTTKRRTAGANKSAKQMAYVGAVYSIRPFRRDCADVINELQRAARQTDRPRPTNKLLAVEMTQVLDEIQEGPQQLFLALKVEVERRIGSRTLICLMDGQKSLWFNQRKFFPDAIPVLDLFHAMEYLWDAAYCFESQGSVAAEKFVTKNLEKLLRGGVKRVIAAFKRKRKSLTKSKLATLEKVIRYFSTNIDHMKYDEYLAAGYPIGSGVVEGACRHLVKDRMERSGMRWKIEGATAVLKLRAFYLNDQWDQLVEHRIQTEQNTLYATAI